MLCGNIAKLNSQCQIMHATKLTQKMKLLIYWACAILA